MLDSLSTMLGNALDQGSLLAFPLIFLVGVLASFTPCTYPVLPLTVGYIGNAAGSRRGAAFILSSALVLGMALVYAIAGTVFAALGMPLGSLMGEGWVLYGIALFFILMALFLLDVFAFPTPKFLSRLPGKASAKAPGLAGAFLTGAVSGLVVGPCTGPILAVVVSYIVGTMEAAETTDGFVLQALGGGLKLFVFGLGQGALILISGTFTGFIVRLPKAGAWMVTLKKGFALLIILGASLILVYVGQNTNFPNLSQALGSLEPDGRQPPAIPESSGENGRFGGDEFLE
jgi:thiol:disulfide interchange protein